MSRREGPGPMDWFGVTLIALVGALAGLLESLLVPLYAGSVVIPVVVALGVASNVLLPRMARSLVATTPAAAAPVLAWLIVVVGFGITVRPEGDVILPGGDLQWVTYGLVLGGALAGTVAVALGAPARGTGGSRGS